MPRQRACVAVAVLMLLPAALADVPPGGAAIALGMTTREIKTCPCWALGVYSDIDSLTNTLPATAGLYTYPEALMGALTSFGDGGQRYVSTCVALVVVVVVVVVLLVVVLLLVLLLLVLVLVLLLLLLTA